jgi:NADH-quinone oxidoreductase subunit F
MVETIQHDSRWEGIEKYSINVREKHVATFLGEQIPIATEHRGIINPIDLDEYLSRGGFRGLKRALRIKSEEIIEEVIESGIRGRGGAGFPTGKKWQTVAEQAISVKYLICNGDEGDPGAFMDRMLLESYPFRVIEGMLIGAYGRAGLLIDILYTGRIPTCCAKRIRQAIDKCREKWHL